jgi:molybdopterin synthase catalytic subunit
MASNGNDWIAIKAGPLDAGRAIEAVSEPSTGGIAVFAGVTRAAVSPEGRALVALDYQAYDEMALPQMRELARRAREHWPIVGLVILHRTGRVALAQPSVVVAISCPHRGEAFDACRWIIDALKAEVAIWKKEIWEGGPESWVHPVAAETRRGGNAETPDAEQ